MVNVPIQVNQQNTVNIRNFVLENYRQQSQVTLFYHISQMTDVFFVFLGKNTSKGPIVISLFSLVIPFAFTKQYLVPTSLKQNSPDPTGTNFPVVFKIRSDTHLEMPRSAFLFPSCLHKICGTMHKLQDQVDACGMGRYCQVFVPKSLPC